MIVIAKGIVNPTNVYGKDHNEDENSIMTGISATLLISREYMHIMQIETILKVK